MIKLIILFFCVLICELSIGQKVETVYLNPTDSSSNLYIVIHPTSPLKGYLFLIPGGFQKANDVLTQTKLPKYAAQNGLLTFIPTFKTGISSFGIDTATQNSFRELLTYIEDKYDLRKVNFYLGGFSIGGSCAIKYTELALVNNFDVKPSAVFAIDAPLDFERMYKSMLRETQLPNSTKDGLAESNYMLKYFREQFGGTPNEALSIYHSLSPYSFNDNTQTAIKSLVNMPIRLYTEPDIQWWISEGVDYSLMNAFDFAAMTNELKRLGNKKIRLITTQNHGYRQPNNKRHPHAWSIAEPQDLVKWLLDQN